MDSVGGPEGIAFPMKAEDNGVKSKSCDGNQFEGWKFESTAAESRTGCSIGIFAEIWKYSASYLSYCHKST